MNSAWLPTGILMAYVLKKNSKRHWAEITHKGIRLGLFSYTRMENKISLPQDGRRVNRLRTLRSSS